MIRYNYVEDVQPPAPFVHLRADNPVNGSTLKDVAAQIDTGADRTLIPESLVEALNLPQLGALLIRATGGAQQRLPTYPLQLRIRNLTPVTLEVVASAGEQWTRIGRDVLNRYRIVIDGPQLTIEIGESAEPSDS